jgi:MFS family permease
VACRETSVRASDHLEGYLGLLRIRRVAMHRNTIIAGGVFLVMALAALAFGLLGGINGRSAYLVWAVVMAIGLSFLSAWVRLEIVKAQMELVDNLQRAIGDGPG